MKTVSLICDWFAPFEDSQPVVLVLVMPEEMELTGLDEHPELWSAFQEAFEKDFGIDEEDGYVSDYIYEVCAMHVDVSPFVYPDTAHFLHFTFN
ncbi:hypothetical protein ABT340_15705 [Streptosporangium sp. NPDC000239]|uniref:hypothetical protein n=1 Tax=Streptosporangium sp. NPDC000239 TaxID=3154248 RepID=UPI0033306C66